MAYTYALRPRLTVDDAKTPPETTPSTGGLCARLRADSALSVLHQQQLQAWGPSFYMSWEAGGGAGASCRKKGHPDN